MKQHKSYTAEELRYLRMLSRQYPTLRSAGTEIINLQAILNLPKGCEHFISDVHGEHEAFLHILNSCSGVIRERLDMLFKDSVPHSELDQLTTLIIYPEEKLEQLKPEIKDLDDNWNLLLRKQGYARLRGAQSLLYWQEKPSENSFSADDTTADLCGDTNDLLEEFLAEAKKSGIENILFIEYPHLIDNKESYERHQRANRAGEMIRSAGFEYISFMDKMDEIGLDPAADFTDSDHMNARGQKKITIYLSELIKDKYDIEPKEQTEKNRARWEDSAELIDCYYELFEEYTGAHKDDPYEKAEFPMEENVRTMKELERIKSEKQL